MKSSSYQIVFLLLALCLTILAFFLKKQTEEKQESEQIQALIFKDEISKGEVTALQIKRLDEMDFSLEKKKGGWQLVQPYREKADNKKVSSFIQDLLAEEALPVLIPPGGSFADYGLDPPFAQMIIEENSKKHEISISQTGNFEGRYYLKKGESLLLGSDKWQGFTSPISDHYIDKKVYPFLARPTGLHFQSSNQNIQLQYKNYQWQWKHGKAPFPLSHSAIEKFWTSLRDEGIQNFSQDKKSKALKGAFWKRPDLKLSLEVLEGEEKINWQLLLKKKSKNRYQLILSHRDYVYETDDVSAEKWLKPDFRDHKAPFSFKLRDLSSIRIQALDRDLEFKKGSAEKSDLSQWEAVKPEGTPVDDKSLADFLDWLGDLEAAAYQKGPLKKRKGGAITLKGAEGEALLKLELGPRFKKKRENQEDEELIWLKSSLSDELAAVPYSDLKEALSPSFLKEKAEKTKDDSD